MKTSNTNENLLERDSGQSAPNILEHPDMRSPVVMQTPPISSSSSSSSPLIFPNDCKHISRTQSGKRKLTNAYNLITILLSS